MCSCVMVWKQIKRLRKLSPSRLAPDPSFTPPDLWSGFWRAGIPPFAWNHQNFAAPTSGARLMSVPNWNALASPHVGLAKVTRVGFEHTPFFRMAPWATALDCLAKASLWRRAASWNFEKKRVSVDVASTGKESLVLLCACVLLASCAGTKFLRAVSAAGNLQLKIIQWVSLC